MYKVFFNDSFLIISDKVPVESEYSQLMELQNFDDIEKWLEDAENNKYPHFSIFLSKNIEKTWEQFSTQFKVIEAAGGLVSNNEQKLLCIFRRGKWDLPKGKLDKNETPEITALREIEEETGLKNLELGKHLTNTYHIYRLKGKLVLKKTYWYAIENKENEKLTPQTEEDIEIATWLSPREIRPLFSNMFGSVMDVFKVAGIKE